MTKHMTKAEALAIFKRDFVPFLTPGDKPERDQAWCNFTDDLNKSGAISDHQVSTWVHPFNRAPRND